MTQPAPGQNAEGAEPAQDDGRYTRAVAYLEGPGDSPRALARGSLLDAVMAEHRGNLKFREGPNNQNPWGPEQGIKNDAYCDSAASMVPYHHGVRWWSDCQFRAKGCARVALHVAAAKHHGQYIEDHASRGKPAPLAIGDLVIFDDPRREGPYNHVETVSNLPHGSTGDLYETIGYNTGNPDGCWRKTQDRKELAGVIKMGWAYDHAAPPPPPTGSHPFPGNLQRGSTGNDVKLVQAVVGVTVDGDFGPNTEAAVKVWQGKHHLKADGIVGPMTWKAMFPPSVPTHGPKPT